LKGVVVADVIAVEVVAEKNPVGKMGGTGKGRTWPILRRDDEELVGARLTGCRIK
jgi:hypothetical protein